MVLYSPSHTGIHWNRSNLVMTKGQIILKASCACGRDLVACVQGCCYFHRHATVVVVNWWDWKFVKRISSGLLHCMWMWIFLRWKFFEVDCFNQLLVECEDIKWLPSLCCKGRVVCMTELIWTYSVRKSNLMLIHVREFVGLWSYSLAEVNSSGFC